MRSRDLETWSIGSYINERRKPATTLLQVKTNLTTSAGLTKTILFDGKSFEKPAQKTACILIKLAQKTATRNATKKPAQLCGKNRPTGHTESHQARGGTSSRCLPSWLSPDLKKKYATLDDLTVKMIRITE